MAQGSKVAFGVIFSLLMLGFCNAAKNPEEKAKDDCEDSTMAYIMSQEFVERRLRSPASAEFPWASDIIAHHLGGCRHEVIAYVDAQNGFGAITRTYYTAKVRFSGDGKWTLENLHFAD